MLHRLFGRIPTDPRLICFVVLLFTLEVSGVSVPAVDRATALASFAASVATPLGRRQR